MREPSNIEALANVEQVDYMGMIFYPKSSRYVAETVDFPPLKGMQKVGVFVDAQAEFISKKIVEYGLAYIQLHGKESPYICDMIRSVFGLQTIKAFSILDHLDKEQLKDYEGVCDYFLFDTKGKLPGGNGFKFDWKVIENYDLATPFFLSGGIQAMDVEKIRAIQHPKLHAIDINSGFEIAPAQKDISLIEGFIKALK